MKDPFGQADEAVLDWALRSTLSALSFGASITVFAAIAPLVFLSGDTEIKKPEPLVNPIIQPEVNTTVSHIGENIVEGKTEYVPVTQGVTSYPNNKIDDNIVSNGVTESVSQEGDKKKEASVNQVQQLISKGKAPKSLEAAGTPRTKFEQPHLHFKGKDALNKDGTWKHGGRKLTNKEVDFIKSIGWKTPK